MLARALLRYALTGAAIGIPYGYAISTHVMHGSIVGALAGGLIGAGIVLVENLLGQARLGETLRRAPFALHVVAKAAIYLSLIWLALAASRYLVLGLTADSITGRDLAFSAGGAFVIAFLLDINRLLGRNVLVNFLTGRYYRPRLEERIFLFVDMKSSTAFGERLGPREFHRLLNRFVSDLSDSIVAHKGKIYRYVGDEVIATWAAADGIAEARCVRAYFDAGARLARRAPDYQRQFGAAASFRGALHVGTVVAGEIVTAKREIAFLGDTVNTTARIEDVSRQFDAPLVASADLVDRLTLPAELRQRSLGKVRLRGKTAELELYAIERTVGAANPASPG